MQALSGFFSLPSSLSLARFMLSPGHSLTLSLSIVMDYCKPCWNSQEWEHFIQVHQMNENNTGHGAYKSKWM